MLDAQKIQPCDTCGGAGGFESFSVPVAGSYPGFQQRISTLETRWRVKCAKCGHMTPHFGSAALALAVWNGDRAGDQQDRLAG